MKTIQPYLTFNGNCREVMEFYAAALGGQVNMFRYDEAPGAPPAEGGERIMHARLMAKTAVLMASDMPPGRSAVIGGNVQLSIECESREEEERIFAALSGGATNIMPLQDTFWGSHFGMLTDRFGVRWMFDLPTAG